MKTRVSPGAVAAGVVIVLILLFFIYRFTLGGNPAQPPITPDNAPDYVKQMRAGKTPSMGAPVGTGANAPTTR
jgi:hypothetical protein